MPSIDEDNAVYRFFCIVWGVAIVAMFGVLKLIGKMP